jgi:hypothetical protein
MLIQSKWLGIYRFWRYSNLNRALEWKHHPILPLKMFGLHMYRYKANADWNIYRTAKINKT